MVLSAAPAEEARRRLARLSQLRPSRDVPTISAFFSSPQLFWARGEEEIWVLSYPICLPFAEPDLVVFFFNKWDSGIKEHSVFLGAEWVREGPAGLRRPRRLSPASHRRLALPGAPSRKLDGQPAALGLSLGRYLLSFVQKNK